ncbi:hypothetical protein [Sulfurimonas sp.]|uniref:hypothetical protein n=1 Tax=Sulfurimonas sp. TaxID=2022749 RepID=UPI00260C02DC|nr:hypothetical protein [Sulfurimonas sp.]MDD3452576.1 hypothetical protein [Sulfurimonas sp.]
MKSTLLVSLLKSKKTKADEIEEAIASYLRDVKAQNKKETEKFVSDLLVYVTQNVENIDKETLLRIVEAKIGALGYTLDTAALEALHEKAAAAAAAEVGAAFVFDKTDAQVLESMQRALVWMKEDGAANTQDRLKEIIGEAMKGDIKLNELGETLRNEFEGVIDESARYFQGVSDHVIRQSQSVTRAYQFEKAGVEEVKVVAVIDKKTSAVCRSMHGRIIPIAAVKSQADAITAAESIEEKKAASRWQSAPIFGKLPSDVALPPYHFRCRTIVVAYFRQNAEIDGKNVNGSLLPGEKYKGNKEVVFSHVDKNFQREYVVTDKTFEHGGNPHNVPKKDIIAGLNSLEKMAFHREFSNRTVGYSSDKKLFYVFEEGEVVTVFDQRKKDYFKQNADIGTIETHSEVKKGEEDERV